MKTTLEQLKVLSEADQLSGKVLDVSIEDYHAVGSPGVSKSDLDLIAQEPYLYYATKISGEAPKKERSSALDVGQMVHDALLEPEKLSKYVCDDLFLSLGSRATKAYKEAVERYEAENPDKILIKKDDYEQVYSMVKSALSIDLVKTLLSGGKPEQSYYWTNKETGILCKARPDYVKVGNKSYVVEVKTTADIHGFERQIAKMKYHIQASQFLEGIQAVTQCDPMELKYIIIAIGKSYPYTPRIMMFDPATLIFSEKQRIMTLETLKKCLITKVFPKKCELKNWGVADVEKIKLPSYLFYDLEFSEENN